MVLSLYWKGGIFFRRSAIRKKNRQFNQEKILDEIRQKVLEESENLKAEKERLLDEKVTLEALQEMTDLPMKRIKEISAEVKTKVRKENRSTESLNYKISKLVTIIVLTTCIGIPVGCSVVAGINAHRQKVQWEKEQKEREDYNKLLEAIDNNNIEMVKYHILEEGAAVEPDVADSESPLMRAVRKSANDIIPFLLDNGADVLRWNKDGQSVMDIADEGTNIVTRKIISNALLETTDEDSPIRKLSAAGLNYSWKSFSACLEKNDGESILLFLQADQGRYANDYDEKGVLICAENGEAEMLELLYDNGSNIDPDSKNIALIYASEEGHIPVIDYLLDLGADINFKYDLSHYSFEQDFTPLISALAEDNKAVEFLLKKGADPNLEGSDYNLLPLMIPVFYINEYNLTESRLQQIRMLLEYGADINRKSSDGATVLEYAQTLRSDESRPVSKLLIKAGAEIPMTEAFFSELVFMNDTENVRTFLEYGMDPDLQGFEYYDAETTALIKAVMLSYDNMAALLIEYGADVNFQTSGYRKTPLLMAVINQDLPMVRLLLDKGAAVNKDVLDRIKSHYTWTNDATQNAIKTLINKHR